VKEADGTDVTVNKNGRVFAVEPNTDQIDDLTDSSKLIRDGSRYWQPS